MMNTPSRDHVDSTRLQIWIGLPHVKVPPGSSLLDGAIGAFVPTLAIARDVDEYACRVSIALRRFGFEIVEIDDVELFDERLRHSEVDPEIVALARTLTEKNPVVFSSFDTYNVEQR